MYSVGSNQKEIKINEILKSLSPQEPPEKCTKIHLVELSQARLLSQNVQQFSPNNCFRTPNPHLAPSTPGPRVSKVANMNTPHTPDKSLKIITHLGLSDDDARYVRGISLIGLSTEYSVKKLRSSLLGNDGQGWAKAEKLTLRKWLS